MPDDIAERSEDTPTLLDNYIEQLETDLNKDKLKTLMKSLYTENSRYRNMSERIMYLFQIMKICKLSTHKL